MFGLSSDNHYEPRAEIGEPATMVTRMSQRNLLDTYVSSDEVERALAFELGYRIVCQHPIEIGVLEATDTLAMDFNTILFDDHETAVAKVKEHASRGGLVGIHTYYPQALDFYQLVPLPNVVVAKTHRLLLEELGCYARLRGRPWTRVAMMALTLESEANDNYENLDAVIQDAGGHWGP